MLTNRNYDPTYDDVINHATELWIRLRVIAVVYSITVFAILFLPTSLLELNFNSSDYKPIVTSLLEFILEWAIKDIVTENFSIIIGSPLSIIVAYLELAIIVGFMINFPFISYQMYLFSSPGLYENEKKILKKLFLALTGLFIIGAAFGFFLMPIVTKTLVGFGDTLDVEALQQFYSLDSVVGFLFWNVIATGLVFTYPILIIALVFAGVLSVEDLQKRRKHVISALLGITAIITPDPTPVSMIVLSLPLILLYEITTNYAYKIETIEEFQDLRKKLVNQWESSTKTLLEYGDS